MLVLALAAVEVPVPSGERPGGESHYTSSGRWYGGARPTGTAVIMVSVQTTL
jgi:hypothetical protein